MTEKKSEGRLLPWLLLIGAAVTFGLTLWLLYHDRPTSAGVSIVMMFGLLIFRVLPDLEFLKISGVLEARLRKKLDEAEELTARLRQSIETFSRLSVALISVSNRWDGFETSEENEFVQEVLAVGRSSDLDPDTLDRIVRPYLAYAALDLFATFKKLVDERLKRYREAIDAGAQAFRTGNGGAIADPESFNRYQQANRGFSPVKIHFSPTVGKDPRLRDVTALCRAYMAHFKLDKGDREAFEAYALELGKLGDRIWAEKSVPNEAMAHKERFRTPADYEKKLEEMFAARTDEWKPFGLD